MRPSLFVHTERSRRFRKALRGPANVSAVIHRTEGGLLIELSNGRVCSLAHDAFGPTTDALTAAMQWARRNGANSVEIAD